MMSHHLLAVIFAEPLPLSCHSQLHLLPSLRHCHSRILEPYVDLFAFRRDQQGDFLFPFQLMAYCPLGFITLSIGGYFYSGSDHLSTAAIFMVMILAPFYVSGIYYSLCCVGTYEPVRVEVDTKHRYVQYIDERRQLNPLFSAEDVIQCTLWRSQLFPHRIDNLELQLVNGQQLYISSLIVEPRDLLARLDLTAEEQVRLLNPPRV